MKDLGIRAWGLGFEVVSLGLYKALRSTHSTCPNTLGEPNPLRQVEWVKGGKADPFGWPKLIE